MVKLSASQGSEIVIQRVKGIVSKWSGKAMELSIKDKPAQVTIGNATTKQNKYFAATRWVMYGRTENARPWNWSSDRLQNVSKADFCSWPAGNYPRCCVCLGTHMAAARGRPQERSHRSFVMCFLDVAVHRTFGRLQRLSELNLDCWVWI